MKTIKFRFQSNNKIYEFINYEGYSELIDEMEADDMDILVLEEKLTIEDFEKSNGEYIKYMEFKNMISDIWSKRKFWKLEDIKRSCNNYDLSGEVFNYLCINETIQEKKLKTKINDDFYPINIMDVCEKMKEYEDFFDYYFTDYQDLEEDYSCLSSLITALITAADGNHYEIYRWFLDFIDLEDDNDDGLKYGLYIGILYGNIEFIEKMIVDFDKYFIGKSLKKINELSLRNIRFNFKHWVDEGKCSRTVETQGENSPTLNIFDKCIKMSNKIKLEYLLTFSDIPDELKEKAELFLVENK